MNTENIYLTSGILNGSAPVMIPGSGNISPPGNSPLGGNNVVGNDNRENVCVILWTAMNINRICLIYKNNNQNTNQRYV